MNKKKERIVQGYGGILHASTINLYIFCRAKIQIIVNSNLATSKKTKTKMSVVI